MTTKQFRKSKRRPSSERANRVAEVKHDADIAELWEVLQEQRPFTPWVPWRSGANAAGLALEASRYYFEFHTLHAHAGIQAIDFLVNLDYALPTTETYHRLQDLLTELQERHNEIGFKLIQIALRCAQLQIANSSGGGHGFNSLLLDIDWTALPILDYQELIRRWRCKDAVGRWPNEKIPNKATERIRRAFLTAWDRGMYTVAYAVVR